MDVSLHVSLLILHIWHLLINVLHFVSGFSTMKYAKGHFSTHSVVTSLLLSWAVSLWQWPALPLSFTWTSKHRRDLWYFSLHLSVSIFLPSLRTVLYNSSYSILATILMPSPHVCHLSHSSAQAAQCSVHFISPVSLSLFFQGSYGHGKPRSIRPGNIKMVISRTGNSYSRYALLWLCSAWRFLNFFLDTSKICTVNIS